MVLSKHVVSGSALRHERWTREIPTLNYINEFNDKPDDLPGKTKWLKLAYATVEKSTIPHEVFDENQASSTLSKVLNEILE